MSQPSQNKIRPEEIINIILKRRWFIIIPFCLAIIVGAYLAITLPKYYEATTTIMVQPQQVSDDIVQSVVSSDFASRLNTITEQVMSRTNIERIIEEFDLFDEPKYENMFLEDKVADVRKQVDIVTNISNRVGESSTFSISFRGSNPEKVKKIVDALAAYFTNENIRVRQNQATITRDFLKDNLETIRQQLEKSDQDYREYRENHRGELPEQEAANLSNLERLSQELIDRQTALRETNTSIAALEQQIADYRSTAQSTLAAGTVENGDTTDLAQLQAQLEALQARYTENHPSVLQLKSRISKLKEIINAGDTEGNVPEGSSSSHAPNIATTPQEDQLASLKLQAQNIEIEITETKKQIEIFENRLENTPKRQEELLAIQRDYNNLQKQYESLLESQLAAELSVNLESKQQGERYKSIDVARVPQKPVSPDMMKLFLITIAAGLGLGGGIVFLLEYMNKSFKSIEDVEATLGIPVLASVPAILHDKDISMKKLNNIFSIVAVIFSGLLFSGFTLIVIKGSDGTLELINRLL